MIKFRAKATLANGSGTNSKVVFDKEEENFSALFNAEKALRNQLCQSLWNLGGTHQRFNPTQGRKGTLVLTIDWECTFNGRAPARPKDVIAAEKARRAAKHQAKLEREAKWEQENQKRIIQLRKRIQNQVDHAFSQGKTGTEPVSKYITCQHCDAPAAFIALSADPPRGATALDEDSITGALCAGHGNNHQQYVGRGVWKQLAKIACDRLEFFYSGIRQIAIKANKP